MDSQGIPGEIKEPNAWDSGIFTIPDDYKHKITGYDIQPEEFREYPEYYQGLVINFVVEPLYEVHTLMIYFFKYKTIIFFDNIHLDEYFDYGTELGIKNMAFNLLKEFMEEIHSKLPIDVDTYFIYHYPTSVDDDVKLKLERLISLLSSNELLAANPIGLYWYKEYKRKIPYSMQYRLLFYRPKITERYYFKKAPYIGPELSSKTTSRFRAYFRGPPEPIIQNPLNKQSLDKPLEWEPIYEFDREQRPDILYPLIEEMKAPPQVDQADQAT